MIDAADEEANVPEEMQQIDLGMLEEIRAGIEQDAPDIADYLMLSEMSRVTHLKHARIWWALAYGKRRPLFGIKRGDRWFVHRLDALQWAHDVASDQQERWQKQATRLGNLVRREQVRSGLIVQPPEQRQRRDPVQKQPAGILCYSWAQAARMLGLTTQTLKQYTSLGQPLEGVKKYRSPDGRVVLSAADIGVAALERKQKEEDEKAHRRETAERRANVVEIRRGAA
jgi:hypothetical protein